MRRIELQLLPAARTEGVPAVWSHTFARRVGIPQPPQEVANDIAREHPIEVVGRQMPARKLRHRRQRHLGQRPLQGVRCRPAPCYVQTKRLA